jgi:hypothetical protein
MAAHAGDHAGQTISCIARISWVDRGQVAVDVDVTVAGCHLDLAQLLPTGPELLACQLLALEHLPASTPSSTVPPRDWGIRIACVRTSPTHGWKRFWTIPVRVGARSARGRLSGQFSAGTRSQAAGYCASDVAGERRDEGRPLRRASGTRRSHTTQLSVASM